ncbi:hypothetical protein C8Q76DRAFT_566295, partial [Earliella scabrosa]
DELDVICGVYKVYTDQSNQTSDKSWWPKHRHWVDAGFYTGRWTAWEEEWFSQHLHGILQGKEVPRSAKDWK